eukprot:TRINITY_DN6577_c1_g1_i1.p1 TRINITY_DN6577_c1_g1~~TRINITY_DN6577_c1_g1_i1.p1  ORF type:complete len:117 (+),score=14.58 TRINITY_DN6577_c1_g1_i1:39-353(+)
MALVSASTFFRSICKVTPFVDCMWIRRGSSHKILNIPQSLALVSHFFCEFPTLHWNTFLETSRFHHCGIVLTISIHLSFPRKKIPQFPGVPIFPLNSLKSRCVR